MMQKIIFRCEKIKKYRKCPPQTQEDARGDGRGRHRGGGRAVRGGAQGLCRQEGPGPHRGEGQGREMNDDLFV